jgi:hypothetical protein
MPGQELSKIIRWIAGATVLVGILLIALALIFERWVQHRASVITLILTVTLIEVTGWYALTTSAIAQSNQALAKATLDMATETKSMAALAGRGLLLQTVPVLTMTVFEVDPPRRKEPFQTPGHSLGLTVTVKNVGQAPAVVTRIRLSALSIDGGGMVYSDDSVTGGRPTLLPPKYALGPGDEFSFRVGVHPDVASDPSRSTCEVFYGDVFGNRFRLRHSPRKAAEVRFLTDPREVWNEAGWDLRDLGVNPTTGHLEPFPEQL